MSAYYGNLLPPGGQLGGGGGVATGTTALGELTSFAHDNKFDTSNFYSSSPAGMRYGEEASPVAGQHFPRFPPYDRIDIHPINSSKSGYSVPVTGSTYQSSGLSTSPYSNTNGNSHANTNITGQYHTPSAEDLSKVPPTPPSAYHGGAGGAPTPQQAPTPDIVGSTSPPSMGVGGPPTSHPQTGMVPPPFGHQNLNGMMHAAQQAQAQNIPIYPWMRPMSGGKENPTTPIPCFLYFIIYHTSPFQLSPPPTLNTKLQTHTQKFYIHHALLFT